VLATLGTQVATISSPAGEGLLWAAAVVAGLVPAIMGLREAFARACAATDGAQGQDGPRCLRRPTR
jgi:hypothetical protein